MILILGEVKDDTLSRTTLECVSAARMLGSSDEIALLLLGSNLSSAANQATTLVPRVLVKDQPNLAQFDPEIWAIAVSDVVRHVQAGYVFFSASRAGRELSPRVAVRLDASLLEDIVSLERDGETIRAEHYTYLARVKERIEGRRPIAVISIKPGAFPPASPSGVTGEQLDVPLELPAPRVRVTGRIAERASGVPLSEADIVVSGGRGVGGAEGFTAYVEALASRLGAAVGATRAVVDEGWRPYAEQVGQTGKSVQPLLYIAIGISGAVQHLSGMSKSRYIVAINRDANAPIFGVADFGIVGDVQQIVPALLAKLD